MLVPNWTLMDCRIVPDAAPVGADMAELATRSLLPCGPNDPELVLAGIRQLGGRLALVSDGQALRMALAVESRTWPIPVLSASASPVCTFGPPLLDAACAVPALSAFLRHAGRPVLLRDVPCDGPFWDALTAAGQVRILNRWERAGLALAGDFDRWFESNFDRKRRKEYRRLQQRLAETGTVVLRSLAPGEDPSSFVTQFLDVEAASWKGRRGTALRADPHASAALADACAALSRAGRLRFWVVEVDGWPVAALYATVDRGQAWLGKIAYNPAFARFSPGVMVVLQATRQLFAEGGIARVDSCAIPGHPMIENIWRDRIPLADVVVVHDGFRPAALSAAAAVLRLHRQARSGLRSIIHRLTGRHRS